MRPKWKHHADERTQPFLASVAGVDIYGYKDYNAPSHNYNQRAGWYIIRWADNLHAYYNSIPANEHRFMGGYAPNYRSGDNDVDRQRYGHERYSIDKWFEELTEQQRDAVLAAICMLETVRQGG
jgi:hypothetical protein